MANTTATATDSISADAITFESTAQETAAYSSFSESASVSEVIAPSAVSDYDSAAASESSSIYSSAAQESASPTPAVSSAEDEQVASSSVSADDETPVTVTAEDASATAFRKRRITYWG